MKIDPRWSIAILTFALAGAICTSRVQASPILGSAQSFAALGAASVTNTGDTAIFGNLGVWPGTSISGLASITISGTTHQTNPVAQQALLDATHAYNEVAIYPITANLTGLDLGTVGTLTPGVYRFDSSAQLTGDLTLDALGSPNSLFIFQIVSSLITASGSSVTVLSGSANTGVFWQVGSSATLGSSTTFLGNILALSSVSLNNSASILCGRAFALNGELTMDTNAISNDCQVGGDLTVGRSDFGSYGFGSSVAPVNGEVPEPATAAMLGLGAGLIALGRRVAFHKV